jgi:hypothetical protein
VNEQDPEYREYLLTPVLESEQMPVPAYSTGAHFFTAFFGGPFAIILFSALNASHMGRLQRDAWRYVLAMILSLVAIGWVISVSQSGSAPPWMVELFDSDTSRAVRWGGRAFGLVVWLALWLPYRRYHKAAEIMGVEMQKPWGPAIGCIVAAIMLQFAMVSALSGL